MITSHTSLWSHQTQSVIISHTVKWHTVCYNNSYSLLSHSAGSVITLHTVCDHISNGLWSHYIWSGIRSYKIILMWSNPTESMITSHRDWYLGRTWQNSFLLSQKYNSGSSYSSLSWYSSFIIQLLVFKIKGCPNKKSPFLILLSVNSQPSMHCFFLSKQIHTQCVHNWRCKRRICLHIDGHPVSAAALFPLSVWWSRLPKAEIIPLCWIYLRHPYLSILPLEDNICKIICAR